MAFIDWSEQLSVKNLTIDSEHKKLVNLINTLHDAMKKGEGSKVIGGVLEELVIYTKTHFKNEEGLMKQHNYVNLDDHIKQHKRFVEEIERFFNNYKSGSVSLSVTLMNYLKDWLVDHIQGSDKKFGLTLAA